jgi:nucleotide-binding universal stress UspA family protein
LAAVSDAELIILHVVSYEPVPVGLQQYAKGEGIPVEGLKAQFHYSKAVGDKVTSEAEARVRKNGLARVTTRVTTRVTEGSPANEIVALAETEGADMVFLGSRGFSDIGGLLMGSVSHKVMHLVPCTCVAVK